MIWKKWIRAEKWPESSFTLPQFQSHRGAHASGFTENTLEAFYESHRQGFEMIECDVRLSADRIPVICHDEDLLRVFGSPLRVASTSAQELWEAHKVPSLEQILQDPLVPQLINVELKSNKASDPLARKVVDIVKKCKAQNRVLFSSFNPAALWILQNYLPETPRALLVSDEMTQENVWWLREMLAGPLLRIHLLHLRESMISADNLCFWLEQKVPVAAWTLTNEERAKSLLDSGVRSVITDLKTGPL